MILSYSDLNVWQNSMNLVEDVYKITVNFPKEEKYGLISQIRRCAVSIPSNIAEGFMRKSTKEYIHFLHIAWFSWRIRYTNGNSRKIKFY